MIPKTIHMVWVGTPRPKKYDFLVDEIKRINYDYQVIEWNDSNINFELKNRDLYDKCENLGAKSDILRFEILNKFGGIYIDYDFLQIKKFDDILECDFFAGSAAECPKEIWNSIVGSVANSQVSSKFLEGLINCQPIKRHEFDRVMNETGPYYLKNVLDQHVFSENIKIYCGTEFFPFPATQRFLIRNLNASDIDYVKTFVKENTYCVHLHTTAWQ